MKTFLDGKVFFHGGMAYHTPCAAGARDRSLEYLNITNRLSNQSNRTMQMRVNTKPGAKRFTSIPLPSDSDVYYGNFVGGRIDFFGSPAVLHFAEYFKNSINSLKYRWTDQTYWHNAMSLFLPRFERRVRSVEMDRIQHARPATHDRSFLHKLDAVMKNKYNDIVSTAAWRVP